MSIRYLFEKSFSITIIQFSFFLFVLCGVAQGETLILHSPEVKPMANGPGDIAWEGLETKHTTVYYQSFDDLKKFNHKIKYEQEEWGVEQLFSTHGPNNLMERIAIKVDALFERAQGILDMRKKMNKVSINIYHDKEQLNDAYSSIYKRPSRFRAWYRYTNNTVYINVNDLHEGMLAHELAHSIIDHYLVFRPPAATAEILARYVDSHLKK